MHLYLKHNGLEQNDFEVDAYTDPIKALSLRQAITI